ncbi:hypothetical protein [[Limnothrix rosea] IAM M-220]|uniref:hypothetical protein n=1 Tax=[Limnothrix rosea] IAM M-220 TaxID=454133 RepID=UPI000960F19A|nr:hypothetical protein [[Limnothrix rosea] IAM M-220]OKH19978.1 hypothetical protein NIES208_00425 [[Limnothrix rosea] IAM M-220]
MTETKAAIAELFYRGKLQEANGKFIPCDFSTGCFTLPFLLIGSFLPLIALVIALGQYTIRKPRSIINFYRKLQTLTFTTNLLIAVLILFAIGLAITLFW